MYQSYSNCSYTYYGIIKDENDAKEIIEKCHHGQLKIIRDRLTESQKQNIEPGHVFVHIKSKDGIIRWTDGKCWTPSKVVAPFLLYYELLRRYPRYGINNSILHPDDEDDFKRLKKDHNSGIRINEGGIEIKQKGFFLYKSEGFLKKTYTYEIDGIAYKLIAYETYSEPLLENNKK
ncbi:hypothetical protein K502DRAFT_348551 [Neoconidiobolus thromboides FSU 785]|nr:hypothetical protein K502DRAFT_348551 [Neoconidiobolus thromboides FSU 785]